MCICKNVKTQIKVHIISIWMLQFYVKYYIDNILLLDNISLISFSIFIEHLPELLMGPVHEKFRTYGKINQWKVSVAQLCPTLYDPIDCSPPGSSVHGILQARILEWVASSFSRWSSQPKDQTWVSCITDGFFYPLSHQGNPKLISRSYKLVSSDVW